MGFGGGSGGGSSAISGATDVSLSSPANNQGLQYNSTTAKWQNGPVASRLVENVNNVASSGSAVTIPDVSTATINNIGLNANCTFTFPTATVGKSFTIRITYANTTSTITWPASVDWPNNITPALTQVTGKKDIFSFACFADGEWTGFVAGLNY
jgi:hypothetical protein